MDMPSVDAARRDRRMVARVEWSVWRSSNSSICPDAILFLCHLDDLADSCLRSPHLHEFCLDICGSPSMQKFVTGASHQLEHALIGRVQNFGIETASTYLALDKLAQVLGLK